MKKIATLLTAFVLFSLVAAARPVNEVTSWWGNWSDKNNWSLKRVPEDGDSIVVAAGKGIVMDKNYSLGNVYIKVIGTLQIKKKLDLDELSFIEVASTGRINAFGADRKNETIRIKSVKKFDEKSLDVYGISYASPKTGVSPSGFVYDNLLPVKFSGFTAVKKQDAIQLNWSTAQESDNSHFEVEKSTDGRNWNMIAMVMGYGTTNTVSNYQYTDKKNSNAVVYYRIRQVDLNGKAYYTDVRTIRESNTPSFKVYASGTNELTIALNNTVARLEVSVYTTDGHKVAAGTYTNAAYQVKQQLPVLPQGIYVVQLNDFSGTAHTQKIVR